MHELYIVHCTCAIYPRKSIMHAYCTLGMHMNHAWAASTGNLLPNAVSHMYVYVVSLVKGDRV